MISIVISSPHSSNTIDITFLESRFPNLILIPYIQYINNKTMENTEVILTQAQMDYIKEIDEMSDAEFIASFTKIK